MDIQEFNRDKKRVLLDDDWQQLENQTHLQQNNKHSIKLLES